MQEVWRKTLQKLQQQTEKGPQFRPQCIFSSLVSLCYTANSCCTYALTNLARDTGFLVEYGVKTIGKRKLGFPIISPTLYISPANPLTGYI